MGRPRILALDNYDSFTFTLVDYLRAAGADVTVARNDEMTVDEAIGRTFDGIMISPGPGRPENAGISVALAAAAIAQHRPLLGVCLGHQAVAVAAGQRVDRVAPVHGKVARVRHDGSGLFAGLPSPIGATRYHSLAALEPTAPLLANAWSEDGVVMGMRHAEAPAHGFQFHPESVGSEHGHALIEAFVSVC
jgi:anthranilate synthase component 2